MAHDPDFAGALRSGRGPGVGRDPSGGGGSGGACPAGFGEVVGDGGAGEGGTCCRADGDGPAGRGFEIAIGVEGAGGFAGGPAGATGGRGALGEALNFAHGCFFSGSLLKAGSSRGQRTVHYNQIFAARPHRRQESPRGPRVQPAREGSAWGYRDLQCAHFEFQKGRLFFDRVIPSA
jgi:hypothetical protein